MGKKERNQKLRKESASQKTKGVRWDKKFRDTEFGHKEVQDYQTLSA